MKVIILNGSPKAKAIQQLLFTKWNEFCNGKALRPSGFMWDICRFMDASPATNVGRRASVLSMIS